MTDPKHKVVYFYDPVTGHVNSTNSSVWHDDHEYLKLPNTVVAHGGYIPAVRTVTHHDGTVETHAEHVDSGWFFVLDPAGKPTVDQAGNYVVKPPQPDPGRPTVHHYLLRAAVNAGHLLASELEPSFLHEVNWAFDSVGQPTLGGTSLVQKPLHEATCTSKHLVKAS